MENFEESISVTSMHPIIISCNYDYKCVCEKMKEEKFTRSWMIEDDLHVKHMIGNSVFTIHFYENRDIIIYAFHKNKPNGSDITDLRALVIFLINKGWNRPSPTTSEVDYVKDFWREAWETGLIDSKYLDNKYGIRKNF